MCAKFHQETGNRLRERDLEDTRQGNVWAFSQVNQECEHILIFGDTKELLNVFGMI